MATIGTFTKTDSGFAGTIQTLGVKATKVAIMRWHAPLGVLILVLTVLRIVWWIFIDKKPEPVAGTSRPCSGACHEVVHAVDQLFPGTSNHGELAGIGALLATLLRGDDPTFDQMAACLGRHELGRNPLDIGLSEDQLTAAVLAAPATRPDRFTILEHLDLDEARARAAVAELVARTRR